MSTPIISARGIGKRYKLGATLGANTLRDHIANSAKRLFARRSKTGDSSSPRSPISHLPSPTSKASSSSPSPNSDLLTPTSKASEFWALRDVDFDIHQGEVVGIIGHNGAGKSTLLKILSQITEPTTGEINVRGRIAALLEVGTGFHPELSGRENIYMNGAILGMTKAEIRSKFDEIVDFAGVEPFLDTPVKRYSSGMAVRLGFAVAAHLEPEILIVDEVLAVGDAEFQRKCLGKMETVSKGGRTILFVSHNLAAMQRLCTRAVILQNGSPSFDGKPSDAIPRYVGARTSKGHIFIARSEDLSPPLSGLQAYISDPLGNPLTGISTGKPIRFAIDAIVNAKLSALEISIGLYNDEGEKILHLTSRDRDSQWRSTIRHISETGSATLQFLCAIDGLPIKPASYHTNLHIACDGREVLYAKDAFSLQLLPNSDNGYRQSSCRKQMLSVSAPAMVGRLKRLVPQGLLRPISSWRKSRATNLSFLQRVAQYSRVSNLSFNQNCYLLAKLRMEAHILDKGMHCEPWSPGRSIAAYERAIILLNQLRGSNDPSFRWAVQVVKCYEDRNGIASALAPVTKKFGSNRTGNPVDQISLLRHLQLRTSTRDFVDGRQVQKQDLKEIIQAALEAPSSCHRQTLRVYATLEPGLARVAGECFHGFTCYSKFVPALLVFCADLRPYNFPKELFTPAVDTALATQNAILMATSKGLSVTLLNWAPTRDSEAKLRTQLGISDHEAIIVGGACGYPRNVARRPVRKPVDKTLVITSSTSK